jgi:hypothetical protein
VNHAGLRNDHDEPVALALVGSDDDLQCGRVQKRTASEVDHQEPLGTQIGFGAFDGLFKIFRVGDVELAEDVQRNNCVEILAYKRRAVI